MTPKDILEKNAHLFETHPLEEMYVKDVVAIIQCMEDYHKAKLQEVAFVIKVGLTELDNYGDWTEFYDDEDYDRYTEGKIKLLEMLSK